MTIAALGAMVVGAGLQYKANQDRKSDMRKLQRRETARQEGYYKEAAQNAQENRETYERRNLEEKMDLAADERQAQYAKADAVAPRANETPIGATGTNQVINDAFARAMAGAQGQAAESGRLRSQLASFGDAMGANAIENNRRTGNIGMMGSFTQGSSNILPLELQHAMTRERGADTWGKVLSAFGGAMLGGGAGLGAGAATTGATAGVSAAAPAMAGSGMGSAMGGVDWSRLFTSAAGG